MTDIKYDLYKFMKDYNVVAKKSFGQNFLKSNAIIKEIVDSFDYSKFETIVEIGPGLGALTLSLVNKNVPKVIAVESDIDMFNTLSQITSTIDNLELVCSDFRRFKFEDHDISKPLIISNLPYNLTTQLIKYSVLNKPVAMGFMVQKEVGENFLLKDKKNVSALSYFLNMIGDVSLVSSLTSTDFEPAPKVDSVFIKVENLHDLEKEYLDILDCLFLRPNKTLLNNLKGSKYEVCIKYLSDYEIKDILSLRARQIEVKEMLKLVKYIKQISDSNR